MKSFIRYLTFVLLLIQFIIGSICNKDNAALWKRAREGSIDLNRTPSPDWSIESNKGTPASPVKNIASTTADPPNKRKRKSVSNAKVQLTDAERVKEQERVLAVRRRTQSRYRKRIWQRIRSGTARETDLRITEASRKSSSKWQKANREKMNEYQRKFTAKRKKIKEEEKKEKDKQK